MFNLFNAATKSNYMYTEGGAVVYKTEAEAQAFADLMNGGGEPFLFVQPAVQSAVACPRCKGAGYLPKFGHVEHGVCFKCRGVGLRATVRPVTSPRHPAFR